MGCCGCSLYTSAIVAAVFGVIEGIGGLTGCIAMLVYQGYTYSFKFSIDVKNGYVQSGFGSYLVGEFQGVLISATVVHSVWLLATILLIIGIIKTNVTLHRLWVGVTSIVMICDAAHTVTIIVVFMREIRNYNSNYTGQLIITFLVLFTVVTRGTVIMWIFNICLTIYTAHRATEIEKGYQPPYSQVVICGGQQQTSAFAMAPGQVIVHHSGFPSGQSVDATPPYNEFENRGYRPADLPAQIPGGIHPD